MHDFRRTAITGLQMAGLSENEMPLMVGATPEVIRKHYEKLDRMVVAKRAIEMRLAAEGSSRTSNPTARIFARLAQKNLAIGSHNGGSQVVTA